MRPSWHAALEKAAGAEAFLDTSLGALVRCCRRPITDRQIGHVWVPAGWFASAVPRRFFLRQARGTGEAQIPAILPGGQPDGSMGRTHPSNIALGPRQAGVAGLLGHIRRWQANSHEQGVAIPVRCLHALRCRRGWWADLLLNRCCPSSKQTDSPMSPVPSLSNGVPASAAAAWKRGLVLGTMYKA